MIFCTISLISVENLLDFSRVPLDYRKENFPAKKRKEIEEQEKKKKKHMYHV